MAALHCNDYDERYISVWIKDCSKVFVVKQVPIKTGRLVFFWKFCFYIVFFFIPDLAINNFNFYKLVTISLGIFYL